MDATDVFSIAANASFRFAASVDVAGVELGTLGVILLIVMLLGGLLLGLWALWVLLFVIGSR